MYIDPSSDDPDEITEADILQGDRQDWLRLTDALQQLGLSAQQFYDTVDAGHMTYRFFNGNTYVHQREVERLRSYLNDLMCERRWNEFDEVIGITGGDDDL